MTVHVRPRERELVLELLGDGGWHSAIDLALRGCDAPATTVEALRAVGVRIETRTDGASCRVWRLADATTVVADAA